VSVVVETGGEKIKGRRKSMRGSDEKEEKEEMTRVHTADFAGLSLFCAPFIINLLQQPHLSAAKGTRMRRHVHFLLQEQHSRKKKLNR
jgi:hypothetical protein